MNGIQDYKLPILQPKPINPDLLQYKFDQCYNLVCEEEFIYSLGIKRIFEDFVKQ